MSDNTTGKLEIIKAVTDPDDKNYAVAQRHEAGAIGLVAADD